MHQIVRMTRSPLRCMAHAVLGLIAMAFIAGTAASPASAQNGVVQGGLVGAGAGAIIGGVTGGGKGAAKGALIGAAAGAILGGAAESNRRHYQGPPRAAYTYGPPPPQGGLVYDVQVSLTRLGYNPGPTDGRYGPRTGDAIAAYQQDNGLPITGQPSEHLLHHMIQRGG